jgi:ferric-dicitrate binding protein FerR (iron transport regulator)
LPPEEQESAGRFSRFREAVEGIRFFEETDAEAGWEKTRLKISDRRRARRQRTRRAAVVACLLAAALLVLIPRERGRTTAGDLSGIPTPERRGAMLQLANGEVVALEGISTVREEDGRVVARQDTVRGLDYRADDARPGEMLRHTAIAPRGTTCKVTLSDGSAVWLNSDTRLTYPVAFPGDARAVELTGEAYFEVAPNARAPFTVKSGAVEVEVTGTAFNLEAYPDDEKTRVTLVEGEVSARAPGPLVARLRPRQQAAFSRVTGALSTAEVDARPFVAWREGEIVLDGEPLEEITRRLERWYDVTFIYDSPEARGLHFRGTIQRHEHVSRVLAMIELTNLATFVRAGEKVIRVCSR